MFTAKKQLHDLTIFLYMRLPQKNFFRRLADFFVHAFTAKKTITRLNNFFVHAFTAKKNLDDLTNFFVHAFTAKKTITQYDLFHVLQEGGIIDKLLGDTALVFFHNPSKGMQAALRMFDSAAARNDEAAQTGGEKTMLDIGMNTGDVCLGTIGTEKRMETTVIGDGVNVASRVASLSKMYQVCGVAVGGRHWIVQGRSGSRLRGWGGVNRAPQDWGFREEGAIDGTVHQFL